MHSRNSFSGMGFRGALEFNPIRMQDNFSQLFLRVSSLSRSPQRLLYAEFFFGPRRRRGKHALIYVRISIYVRCAPTAPRGSQAWTPQPPFVILMSHYIFVWGVGGWNPKCETRCNAGSSWNSIFPWGSPTWPWALCPLKRFPSIRWYLSVQRVSLLPPLSIFTIKRRIYHIPPFSKLYSFTIYSSNPKYFAAIQMFRRTSSNA